MIYAHHSLFIHFPSLQLLILEYYHTMGQSQIIGIGSQMEKNDPSRLIQNSNSNMYVSLDVYPR